MSSNSAAPGTLSDHARGVLLLISAAVVWSFGGLLIKLVSLGPLATAGARSAIAAVVIWGFARGERIRFTGNLVMGAVAYAGTVSLFVAATKMTTAANAILLQYTAPVWVALLTPWLLKEKIRAVDWWTIAVVLAGMTFFFLGRLSTDGTIGNLLAITSGFFFALTVVFLRRDHAGSPLQIVLFGNIVTAFIGIPALASETFAGADLLWLLLLGVGQLGIGYILFVRGVRRVPAIESALIPILEPILNPFWVAILQGETPTSYAVLGGAVVVGAVTMRGVYMARLQKGGAGND